MLLTPIGFLYVYASFLFEIGSKNYLGNFITLDMEDYRLKWSERYNNTVVTD